LNTSLPSVQGLVSSKQIIKLQLGKEPIQEIEIELSVGKLVKSGVVSWSFDCTHNNDLVDYFKTMFEGGL
jgi:hypothetical protein